MAIRKKRVCFSFDLHTGKSGKRFCYKFDDSVIRAVKRSRATIFFAHDSLIKLFYGNSISAIL